jgi:hypothetical protein
VHGRSVSARRREEPRDTVLHGDAMVDWLGEAFLVLRTTVDHKLLWDLVIGHSDARERYVS